MSYGEWLVKKRKEEEEKQGMRETVSPSTNRQTTTASQSEPVRGASSYGEWIARKRFNEPDRKTTGRSETAVPAASTRQQEQAAQRQNEALNTTRNEASNSAASEAPKGRSEIEKRMGELRNKQVELNRFKSGAQRGGMQDVVARYDTQLADVRAEMSALEEQLKELNENAPAYSPDTAKSLLGNAESAEKALSAERESGKTILAELDGIKAQIPDKEKNLEALLASYEANPTPQAYEQYNKAYQDYAAMVEGYNALYSEYEQLYNAYDQAANEYNTYMDTARSDASVWEIAKNVVNTGITGIGAGLTRTFALPELITQKVFPGVATPITDFADWHQEGYEDAAQKLQESLYGRSGAEKFLAEDLGVGVVQAIPNAILAYMSGGTSMAAQGSGTLLTGAANSSLATAIGTATKEMVKNPSYWMSVAQTLGPDFEDAKKNGATDLEAAATAIISSALNAGVEVSGGIETLPGDLQKGNTSALLAWVKSMPQEGLEEVVQGIISGTTQKGIYDHDKAVFSLTDEGAIINPERMAKEFGVGAAVGGILGGVQVGAASAANAVGSRLQRRDAGQQPEAVPEIAEQEPADLEATLAQIAREAVAEENSAVDIDSDEGRREFPGVNRVLGDAETAQPPAAQRVREVLPQADGKPVTRQQVEKLIASNEVYIQNENRQTAKATAQATRAADAEKLGYGEHGMAALEKLSERQEMAVEEVNAEFHLPYLRGLSNMDMKSAGIKTEAQREAFNAGRMDRIANLGKDAAKTALVSSNAGFDYKSPHIPKTMSKATQDVFNDFSVALGTRTTVLEKIAAGGRESGANAITLADGSIGLSADTDIAKTPSYFFHEGLHRMKQLAPAETREFINAVVASTISDGATSSVEAMQNFAAERNVNLTVDSAMEEIAADRAGEMFGGDVNRAAAILRDVMGEIETEAKKNGKTETEAKTHARNVVQKFIDAIRSVIQSLKDYLSKNKGRMSEESRSEFEAAISDLTAEEQLWKDALKAAVKSAREKVETGSQQEYTGGNKGQFSMKEDASRERSLQDRGRVQSVSEVNSGRYSRSDRRGDGRSRETLEGKPQRAAWKELSPNERAVYSRHIFVAVDHYTDLRALAEVFGDAKVAEAAVDAWAGDPAQFNAKWGKYLDVVSALEDARREISERKQTAVQRKTMIDTSGMSEAGKTVVNNLKRHTMLSRYGSRKYASFSNDRITRELLDGSYRGKPDAAKHYIAWVEPSDFVYATVGSYEAKQQIENESHPLDLEGLRVETQPIYLRVNFETGEIVGHEGRHRMTALKNAGVDRVAVVLKSVGDMIERAEPIERIRLQGQQFESGRGAGFRVDDALPLSGRYADAVRTLFSEIDGSVRFSLKDNDLTEAQQKNYNYNQKQTETGSTLKTLKGSAIKRSKYGVGKEIGGTVYLHKDYATDVIPAETFREAADILSQARPDFEYNAVMWNPATGAVRFDEAPDFDTAREPVVGNTVTINPETGTVKDGHSDYIWHHKWIWVKNDYDGFNVREAWEWSKEWLSVLPVASDGNGIERWNAQLDTYGLPRAGENKPDSRFSLKTVAPVQPTSDKWQRGHTEAWFVEQGFPLYRDVSEEQAAANADAGQTTRGGKHGTQITSTKQTYEQLFKVLQAEHPNDWKNLRVLDASSGLGLGTRIGRNMGFDVTDIEPFPSENDYMYDKAEDGAKNPHPGKFHPNYTDYSLLQQEVDDGETEGFDYIISNAVLNVIPQDTRDNLVVAMGNLLKPGGQMFINVISRNYDGAIKSKPEIQRNAKGVPTGAVRTAEGDYSTGGNNTGRGHETFVWKSNSVQKVFSYNELVAYLEDALGGGYTVEPYKKLGMTAALVTKDGAAKFSLKSVDNDMRSYAEIVEEQQKLRQREIRLDERKRAANNNPELLRALDDYHGFFAEMKELLSKKHKGTATKEELERIEEVKELREELLKRVADIQESLGLSAIAEEEREIRELRESLRVASDAAWAREGAEKENKAIEKAGVSAPEYFRKKALKAFKTTTNFNEAGYLLPDGKLLNFSGGERNHRYRDHREIGEIYEATQGTAALNRFLSDGNIRIMAESPGIDLAAGVEPTKEQYAALRRFINTNGKKDGQFFVDFSGTGGNRVGKYSYEDYVNADRILNDIKYFYETGEVREQSEVSKFHGMWSLKGQSDLLKENAKLKEVNAALKEQFKTTKFAQVDKKSLDAFTKKLLQDYQSGADINETRDALNDLYTYMANGEDGNAPAWNEVQRRAYETAVSVLEGASTVNDDLYREYKHLRDRLRSYGMTISPEYDQDLMGYESINEFRKANFGRIKLVKNGTPVDVVYQDLASAYPEFFDDTEYTTQADQLTHIAEVLDSLQPYEVNPYSYNMRESATWLANDIIERFYELPQAKPTFADKAQQKLTKQVIKDAKKLERVRDQKNERIAKLIERNREKVNATQQRERAKRAEAVERVREHYEAKEARASDRRKASLWRKKIKTHVDTISRLLLKGNDNSHVPEEMRTVVGEFLSVIDLTTPRQQDATIRRLQDLQSLYRQIAENKTDIDIEVDPDLQANMDEVLAALRNGKDTVTVADLNNRELEALYRVLLAVERSIYLHNRRMAEGKTAEISDLAQRVMIENGTSKAYREHNKVGQWAADMVNMDMLNPQDYFIQLGDTMNDLFQSIRDGFDKKIRHLAEAQQYMDELLGDADAKSMSDKKATAKEFKTGNGATIRLTPAQVMSLYLLQRQPDALDHIYKGGIKPAPVVALDGKSRRPKVQRAYEVVKVTPDDVANILDSMTAEQKRIAEGIGKFFTDYTAKWGNEVSMELYGYKKFTVENYFPIVSDQNYLKDVFGETNDATLKNMGSTKARIKGASNPVIIEDVFDVFSRQADSMSSYNAFVIPLSDIQRVYNFKTVNGSVKQSIEKKFGVRATGYFKKLMTDINGGARWNGGAQWMNELISRYKQAKLGLNLRVIVQQPTAMLRAQAVIDTKYIAQALAHKSSVDLETIYKYAPVAQWKNWGFFSMDTGKQMKDVLMDNKQLSDYTMWAAGKMDEITWKRLWVAAEMEVRDKQDDLTVGSEEYLQAVGKRFSEIIDRTQVVDSVLHRSQIMRNPDTLVKMSVSFMNEPFKAYNMVRTAVSQFRNNPTEATQKALWMAGVGFLSTLVVNHLATALVDTYRGDEDDEEWLEKMFKWVTGQSDEEPEPKTWGQRYWWHFADNAVNEPLSMFPVVKDIVSLAQGYDIKRMDMQGIGDFVNALKRGLSDKYTPLQKIVDIGGKLGDLFGVPASSVKREIGALVNLGVGAAGNPMVEYTLDKMLYSVTGNKKRFLDILYEAYKQGDMDVYKKIAQDMIDKGVEPTAIESGMKSRAKKDNYIVGYLDKDSFSVGIELKLPTEEKDENKFTLDNLTGAQYNQYSEEHGALLEGIINEFERRGFGSLDNDTANALLSAAYTYAEETALEGASGGQYESDTKWVDYAQNADDLGMTAAEYIWAKGTHDASITADGVYKAYEAGVDVEDYLTFRDLVNDLEAGVDYEKGDTESRQAAIKMILMEIPGLTQDEYDYLYGTEYKAKSGFGGGFGKSFEDSFGKKFGNTFGK